MVSLNEKNRLLKLLKNKEVDRPPVICPGGMMNAGVTELLTDIAGNHNTELEAMVETAKRIYTLTGFENYGVPFCMTTECEPFDVRVDFGDKNSEPRVVEYNSRKITEIMNNYENTSEKIKELNE